MDDDDTSLLTIRRDNSKEIQQFISLAKPSAPVQGSVNSGKINILCYFCILANPSQKSVENYAKINFLTVGTVVRALSQPMRACSFCMPLG